MPGGGPGSSDAHLGGPGGMQGMLSGSSGSGAHDFRQQISTGYGSGLGQASGAGGSNAGIASLASLLGNFVPVDPRAEGGLGAGLEGSAAGQETAAPGGRGPGLEGARGTTQPVRMPRRPPPRTLPAHEPICGTLCLLYVFQECKCVAH